MVLGDWGLIGSWRFNIGTIWWTAVLGDRGPEGRIIQGMKISKTLHHDQTKQIPYCINWNARSHAIRIWDFAVVQFEWREIENEPAATSAESVSAVIFFLQLMTIHEQLLSVSSRLGPNFLRHFLCYTDIKQILALKVLETGDFY